jgi:hypothetical protein
MEQMNNSEILLYQTKDGQTKIDVRLEKESVWLSQAQMAELFQTTKQNISLHIKNIFDENELSENSTVKEYLTVQAEGKREIKRNLNFYNLDVIISVGYRVKSPQGTQFRIWATKRIHEYIVKGFTMDDDRLKQEGARSRYFEELLQRIRDIRSSERNFYQKVTDIYSTSIDYKEDEELTKLFFATVQTFALPPKFPLVCFRIFFLLARDATLLTLLGIILIFRMVSALLQVGSLSANSLGYVLIS